MCEDRRGPSILLALGAALTVGSPRIPTTMPRSLLGSISFLFAITACAVKTDTPADTINVASSSSTVTTSVDTTSPPTIPAPAPQMPAPSDPSRTPNMTVTEYGIGLIRAGMTVAEVNSAIGGGFAAPKGGASGCSYATLVKGPPGLAVMLENGRVARVEVRSGSIPTSTGARIGDSESRIKSLYPGITTTPHKYIAAGHYLTVSGSDPADRIVFETDGSKVTKFRSGATPAVEYVEVRLTPDQAIPEPRRALSARTATYSA